jgi:hypothetical protein
MMLAAMRGYNILLIVGALLVVGVVAWRLMSSSYSRDVAAVCDAEARSGALVAKEPVKVVNWMKSNVDSAEGVALVTDLSQKRKGDAATELAAEAKKVKLASCPLADAYAKVQSDSDYKADMARMCAGLEFPNLETQSDDARIARIKEWADKKATSPRTASFVHELEGLPANARGKRMRDEAAANDKFMCEVAATLDAPQAVKPTGGGPQIRMLAPQINGNLTVDTFNKQIDPVVPKIKKCYTDALASKPDLEGRIVSKLAIGEKGNVLKASEGVGGFPDSGVVQCVTKILEGLQFGPQTGPATVVFAPIDFTPN